MIIFSSTGTQDGSEESFRDRPRHDSEKFCASIGDLLVMHALAGCWFKGLEVAYYPCNPAC